MISPSQHVCLPNLCRLLHAEHLQLALITISLEPCQAKDEAYALDSSFVADAHCNANANTLILGQ